MSKKYLNPYDDSLKYYRDLKASLDTSYEEGIEKGKHERTFEIARELLANGIDTTSIMSSTGLTREQIERLK